MSLCAVDLTWGDGPHRFALPLAQLEELQEKVDAGPLVLLRRLQTETWRLRDVRETIRLGLIGGGTKPSDALTLVGRYLDAGGEWLVGVLLAVAILDAVMIGKPDEPLGKQEAGEMRAPLPAETEKLDFRDFYGLGTVMGFSPRQVGEMSLWQFMACADGYARANSSDGVNELRPDEFADVAAMLDAAPTTIH